MTVTIILRLDAGSLAKGELRGWAELVSRAERVAIDGPDSILAAARQTAPAEARRAAARSEGEPLERT